MKALLAKTNQSVTKLPSWLYSSHFTIAVVAIAGKTSGVLFPPTASLREGWRRSHGVWVACPLAQRGDGQPLAMTGIQALRGDSGYLTMAYINVDHWGHG